MAASPTVRTKCDRKRTARAHTSPHTNIGWLCAGTVPLETRVSRQELAAAAASRPGRTKRDHKRKAQAPPGATDAAADLIRVEAVPKNHPALYTFSRVEVCKYDRAPEVQLSEDRLGAIFRLGFRMVRHPC